MDLRKYRETKKALDGAAKEKAACQGAHCIALTVSDDTDFLSPLSESGAPVISGAVAECIEASAEGVRPGAALTLKIKSGCIDEAEKARYRAAVKAYYTGKYIAAGRELSRNRTVSLLLAAAGVLVLALALIFEQLIAPVWAEVLDIVAWVFLWEATDIWFLSSAKLRRERRRCISLVAMQVDFEALDEKK